MPSKIIGISGSPVKKGNVDAFLGSIMDLATKKGLDCVGLILKGFGGAEPPAAGGLRLEAGRWMKEDGRKVVVFWRPSS